jgi:hypothetical protein
MAPKGLCRIHLWAYSKLVPTSTSCSRAQRDYMTQILIQGVGIFTDLLGAWLSHCVMPWSVSSVFVFVSTHLQMSPVFPISSRCIYPCVSCLSVPVHLVFAKSTSVSPSSYFSQSLFFPSPPGFDPCLSWRQVHLPEHSACSDLEPAYRLVLFGLWPGLWTLACPQPAFCLPLFV